MTFDKPAAICLVIHLPKTIVALGFAYAFACAKPVYSQAPGYQMLDPRSVGVEYVAEVLDRINENLADWGRAWANDLPEELVELYWEDAMLLPPGGIPLRGHDELREYFATALPEHGHIEAFMLDFDASGQMAQVFGNYMLGIQQGEEAGTQKTGPMLTIYMMRGRTWKIRSQVFIGS